MNIKSDLAAAYKILSFLSMDDHTYTHLSARPLGANFYYIYPFGLRFSEVTSENLIKVTLDGKILEGKEYQYNKTGYSIHGAIYKERSDISSIFHFHTPSVVAVSADRRGLLPISQWALHFYDKISYHNYNSLILDSKQSQKLVKDLGDNFVLLLRNHGAITCGRTVQESMFYSYHLEQACKTQCLAPKQSKYLSIPSKKICQQTVKEVLSFESNLGERDWQAWLRLID